MKNSTFAGIGGLIALLSGLGGCAAIASKGYETPQVGRMIVHRVYGTPEERAEQRLEFHRQSKGYSELIEKYGAEGLVGIALSISARGIEYLE